MTSFSLSLLGVNSGVENRIISFVSSGNWANGGLQDVLNMRLVCSTTKSWVDNLPKPQADVVFAKAKVKINFDESHISNFLLSPPPFGVTTLYLRVKGIDPPEFKPLRDDDLWTRFCAFWSSKLETFEPRPYLVRPSQSRIVDLLESKNLLRFRLDSPFVLHYRSPFISCLQKITELHLSTIEFEDSDRSQFFLQLENNNNLTVLSMDLYLKEDFESISKFIDYKKDDTQFHFTFGMKYNEHRRIQKEMNPDIDIDESLDIGSGLRDFGASVVTSKSKIRLVKIEDFGDFDKLMNELLPRSACLELLTKIESVEHWEPTEESLSLLENCTHLRRLANLEIGDSLIKFDLLTFPSLLEELGFTKGFPPCGRFPQSLISLRLSKCKCDIKSLMSFLNLVRSHCPRLASLEILEWQAAEELTPAGDYDRAPPFTTLKKLVFTGELQNTNQKMQFWSILTSEFEWRSLELSYLRLSFETSNHSPPHLVDEDILKGLYEGPSFRSLEDIQIFNCFTPVANRMLKKLVSFTLKNVRRRKVKWGRWQQ